jgi:hypothetical protein
MSKGGGVLLRLLQISLVLLGLGWVTGLLLTELSGQRLMYVLPASWVSLSIGTGLLVASLSFGAIGFHVLLSSAAAERVRLLTSVSLHVVAQIVRYVPGRFWGLLYQVAAARAVATPVAVTRANVDLMFLTLVGNAVVATALLAWFNAIPPWAGVLCGLLALSFLLSVYATALPHVVSARLEGQVWLPRRVTGFLRAVAGSSLSYRAITKFGVCFLLAWLLYLGAWQCLDDVFPLLRGEELIVLCAWYSIAWMLGFVSAITPGGLGVREAGFVVMAGGVASAEVLAFIAIVARVWLMLGDILLALVVVPVQQMRKAHA